MNNDDGIIFGAGGQWSRDPSLVTNPALACSGIVSGARGGGGLATPPSWSAPRSRALGVIIMTGV